MKNLILLTVFSIFIVGCGDVGTIYFPLSVGNIWNYSMTTTYTDTMTTPDSTWTDTRTRTVEITRETTLDNGTKVLETVMTDVLNDTPIYIDTVYYQETGDGIYYYHNKSSNHYNTELEFPIEQGKTWTFYTSFTGMTIAVVLGKEDIDVPAGDYDDCWKIGHVSSFFRDPGDTTYVYYAENVGMVKTSLIIHAVPTSITTLIELENATIK